MRCLRGGARQLPAARCGVVAALQLPQPLTDLMHSKGGPCKEGTGGNVSPGNGGAAATCSPPQRLSAAVQLPQSLADLRPEGTSELAIWSRATYLNRNGAFGCRLQQRQCQRSCQAPQPDLTCERLLAAAVPGHRSE